MVKSLEKNRLLTISKNTSIINMYYLKENPLGRNEINHAKKKLEKNRNDNFNNSLHIQCHGKINTQTIFKKRNALFGRIYV